MAEKARTAQAAETALRVGELAKRAGLTVRTLHHYEAIGLLAPSGRTEAGYRLYAAADVARLGQIVGLRQLGLSLDEIRECLSRPGFSLARVVALQRARVAEQIERLQSLDRSLDDVARLLAHTDGRATTDDVLRLMEVTHMVERYYTPEQLDYLKRRREEVGEGRIREVEGEWPRLMAAVRAAMGAGTDPADPSVQALAHRWHGLVREFTGGDPGISASLMRMYDENDQVAGSPVDREMMAYVGEAMQAAGLSM